MLVVDDDLLFSLLDHLISLAVHDDAFEAQSAKNVENMLWVKMPPRKKSLTWSGSVMPWIFPYSVRSYGGSGRVRRASPWIGYLKRLGEKAGFQQSFSQYGLRRI